MSLQTTNSIDLNPSSVSVYNPSNDSNYSADSSLYGGSANDLMMENSSYSDPRGEKLADDLMRWTLCSLILQTLVVIFFGLAWIPGVDWFHISMFNGSPELGQQVGLISGCLYFTTVDPLGWNGAPFTWVDTEEMEIQCQGPLITSENCQGLMNKVNCLNLYSLLFALAMACLIPGLVFTSYLVHQLRFGLVERVQDMATLGYWGCVTSNPKWWFDPCTYIYLQSIIFVPMVLLGIPAFPVALSFTMRFWYGTAGLWFGGGQTIFGAQGLLGMDFGYDIMAIGTTLLPLIIYLTVKLRDNYRDLVYCGGVDHTDDATQFGNVLVETLLGRARGFTKILDYVPSITFSGQQKIENGDDATRDRSSSSAPPRDRSTSASPSAPYNNNSGGGREYSKSTLDQMIPSEEEMAGGTMNPPMDDFSGQSFGKVGASQHQAPRQQVKREEPDGLENPFGDFGKSL